MKSIIKIVFLFLFISIVGCSSETSQTTDNPLPSATEISAEKSDINEKSTQGLCGTYPNCSSTTCFGKEQRCNCSKDDKNKQCKLSACRHDGSCP